MTVLTAWLMFFSWLVGAGMGGLVQRRHEDRHREAWRENAWRAFEEGR